MKPIWKILLFCLIALVCLRFLPVLLVPVVLGLMAAFVIGALLAGGVMTVAATGLSVVAGILTVILVLLAVLSPLWVPVLAIYGLIALFRRNGKAAA